MKSPASTNAIGASADPPGFPSTLSIFKVSSVTGSLSSARKKTTALVESSSFSTVKIHFFIIATDLGGPKSLILIRPTKGLLGLLIEGMRVCSRYNS